MSGLCGIWSPSPSATPLSQRVQRGLEAMVHRGRDGFAIYPQEQLALGHCLFETGCNGFMVDEQGFAISFDGRLDNRAALQASLHAQGCNYSPRDEALSDTALLLHAYRQFGPDLPQQLRGDFAIAIWDADENRLFLCRDHFGVRPLFYRWAMGAFLFASEIKALTAMVPEAPLTIREQAIAGFVDGQLDAASPEASYYAEVFRLLPGHFAVIDGQGVRFTRYWRLDPGLPVRDADHEGQFRALLAQAINRRLRSALPVGALLSGGLDSSSIVSMIGSRNTGAHPADIRIFSLVFPQEAKGDESPYIDSVLQAYPFPAHKVDGSSVSALADADAIIAEQDHPPPAPNASTFRHLLHRLTAESDVRVVLHGHGGDETVSYGTGLFMELATSGRWLKLWNALRESESQTGPSWPLFRRLIRVHGLRALRAAVRRWTSPIADNQEERLVARVATDGSVRPAEQRFHLEKLADPLFPHALEVTDHEAAAAGIELRLPYLDVDLVTFCVTVPAEVKWQNGLPRALMRRALDGILPPLVRDRTDKFDFSAHVARTMRTHHALMVDQALHAEAFWLESYADLPSLRAAWHRLREGDDLQPSELMQLWRAVMLSRWLRTAGGRSVPAALEAAA